MNRSRLARMKPTAHLLNFGQDDLVVDQELIDAVNTTARRSDLQQVLAHHDGSRVVPCRRGL